MSPRTGVAQLVFSFACVLAGVAPLMSSSALRAAAPHVHQAPDWSHLRAQGWLPAALTELDRAFATSQAGPLARFRKGHTRLVARHLTEATRRLHPVADCLRAVGYEVERAPATDETHVGASTWVARRGAETLHVEEWIEDADGNEFAEVGQWYWQALLGGSRGPWKAYVRSEVHRGGASAD